jgi:magnesium-transporting ATPase (P-type)
VRIEAGGASSADGSLVEVHGIMIDESIVTGESFPS